MIIRKNALKSVNWQHFCQFLFLLQAILNNYNYNHNEVVSIYISSILYAQTEWPKPINQTHFNSLHVTKKPSIIYTLPAWFQFLSSFGSK